MKLILLLLTTLFLGGCLSSTERIKLKEQPPKKPIVEKCTEPEPKKTADYLQAGDIKSINHAGSSFHSSWVEQLREKPRAEKWAEDDHKKMEEFLEKGGISRGNNVRSHTNNSRVEPYPYLISK